MSKISRNFALDRQDRFLVQFSIDFDCGFGFRFFKVIDLKKWSFQLKTIDPKNHQKVNKIKKSFLQRQPCYPVHPAYYTPN